MNAYEKMREVLKNLKVINDQRLHDALGYEIDDIITEALAEPPRNCDVGTADEQQARHCAWCRKDGIDGNNKVNCAHPDMSCELCALRWAQMPYEEGGKK